TETDLFGEQTTLCGGISHLIKAAYETLVEAGYQPEVAYFECMHEMKLIVDLFYQGGLAYMRYSVSDTAEYGDYTRGPRVVSEQTKAEKKKILGEIQSGQFAREWVLENQANRAGFLAMRRRDAEHSIEEVGKRLRSVMAVIAPPRMGGCRRSPSRARVGRSSRFRRRSPPGSRSPAGASSQCRSRRRPWPPSAFSQIPSGKHPPFPARGCRRPPAA